MNQYKPYIKADLALLVFLFASLLADNMSSPLSEWLNIFSTIGVFIGLGLIIKQTYLDLKKQEE